MTLAQSTARRSRVLPFWAGMGLGKLMFADIKPESQRRVWSTIAQTVFRPQGLWLWGHTERTKIELVTIRMQEQRVSLPVPEYKAPCGLHEFKECVLAVNPTPLLNFDQPLNSYNVYWDHMLRGDELMVTVAGPLQAALIWGTAWR